MRASASRRPGTMKAFRPSCVTLSSCSSEAQRTVSNDRRTSGRLPCTGNQTIASPGTFSATALAADSGLSLMAWAASPIPSSSSIDARSCGPLRHAVADIRILALAWPQSVRRSRCTSLSGLAATWHSSTTTA